MLSQPSSLGEGLPAPPFHDIRHYPFRGRMKAFTEFLSQLAFCRTPKDRASLTRFLVAPCPVMSCAVLPSFPSHRRLSSTFHTDETDVAYSFFPLQQACINTLRPKASLNAFLSFFFPVFFPVFLGGVRNLRIPYCFSLFVHRQNFAQNRKDITSTQKTQLLHPTLDVHIMYRLCLAAQ